MIKRLLSLLIAIVMLLSMAAFASAETADDAASTIVYGTAPFGMKFSPFFATTAYDMEVVDLFTPGLLAADRGGNIIRNGIEGETVEYNGTEYTYYGMGNVEIVQNDDGTVDYNLTMRDDIVFSDGEPANIDDVIFSLYVLADPTYDGGNTYYALPIEGMAEYYNAMAPLASLLIEAGPDNTDFSGWDEDTQTAFWADIDTAGAQFAQEIIDYCVADYADDYGSDIDATGDEIRADEGLQVQFGMVEWGFGDFWTEGATAADYWAAMCEAYEGDVMSISDVESAGSSLFDFIEDYGEKYGYGVAAGDAVDHISGVIRTGDYSMTIHMTEYDATAIYNMSIPVAPLHYYGDPALYDYENNSFGFPKGDLSIVRSKTTQPLGCGPYIFDNYNNGVVTMKANPYYFQGEPVAKTLLMQEVPTDSDYIPGIVTGTLDLAQPSISADAVAALEDANGGELTGDVLTTYLVDYRGYGYLAINADRMFVGDDPSSEESKALRKGFMTMLAVYRDTVINSYYGDRAAVIQYPISNTSWAAPRPTDEGYQNCYSTTVDGAPIYDASMNDEQKYEAALVAAIDYFKAAGYAWDDASSTFTAAPEGAALTYEAMIPGGGVQDHPAYGIAVAASEALATIGITLQVSDVGTSTWNNALEAHTFDMIAGAWQATADPDMTQVYHSTNAHGNGTNSNHYSIDDADLDALIEAGRASADNDFRKATYKSAMEIILDWGVELPLYQRKDCTVVSTERIDTDTMPKDMTPYWGWYAEIETLTPNAVAAAE